jgi:hypothetical protein
LCAWNDYKIVTLSWPLYIMNHSIEYWYKCSLLSTDELYELETMLSIVTLAWWINVILRPNKYSSTSRWWSDINFLSFTALYSKFRSFNSRVQIKEEYMSALIIWLSKTFWVLPSNHISWLLLSWLIRTYRNKVNSVKPKTLSLLNFLIWFLAKSLRICHNSCFWLFKITIFIKVYCGFWR